MCEPSGGSFSLDYGISEKDLKFRLLYRGKSFFSDRNSEKGCLREVSSGSETWTTCNLFMVAMVKKDVARDIDLSA